jgi:hypothetical protein
MAFDPFSIRSLLTLPELDGDDSSTWRLSPFEKSLIPTTFALDVPEEKELQELQTGLFCLDLDDVSLAEIESITSSAVGTDTGSDGGNLDGGSPGTENDENIWAFKDVVDVLHTDGLLSWDNCGGIDRNAAYLSEAAGGCLEQALHLPPGKDDLVLLKYADADILQTSLRELSMGRNSVFFCYDPVKASFITQYEAQVLQNVSLDLSGQLTAGFLQLGKGMRALRSFVKQGPVSSRSRVRAALSAAIGLAVHALESEIGSSSTAVMSTLQLQEMVRKPGILVACLQALIEDCPKDAEGLAHIVRTCDTLCGKHPWLRETLQETVARSVSSQIEAVGRSVGVGTVLGHLVGENTSTPVSTGDLLAAEIAEVVVESQEALTLLRETCPDHQLFAHTTASRTNLQWAYSWEAILKLENVAMNYEASLKQAILDTRAITNSLPADLPPNLMPGFGVSFEQPSHILQPPNLLNPFENWLPAFILGFPDHENPVCPQTVLGSETPSSQDRLFHLVSSALSSETAQVFDLQPELEQSMSLSMAPLLMAQHRLLSYSVLSLIFEVHDLKTHLLLQDRFQLLGDGVFTSRLARALFDSFEASGEGRRRDGGRTGLRLQSRGTWPPASSELRLVLMGVLSESVSSDTQSRGNITMIDAKRPLRPAPGLESLSFAIRDLSDEDLEKCRDVDTIHALDFLTLQYKPPSPLLETVITSRSLKLYDDIFVHLLRLLRVKCAAQELVTNVIARSRSKNRATIPRNHRTRLAIHHFVSTLADWIQNSVIAQKWTSFATTLDQVEKGLKRQDYDGTLEAGRGLKFIKHLHEDVVDDIARTLFLKKKYTEVRAVLDRIFNIVLQFAKQVRMENADEEDRNDAAVRRLHDSFQKEVKNFLAYLYSNSSGTEGERDSRGPEALMEQLALRLDTYGFYTDKG